MPRSPEYGAPRQPHLPWVVWVDKVGREVVRGWGRGGERVWGRFVDRVGERGSVHRIRCTASATPRISRWEGLVDG